jgi:hypothetical protein
MLPRPSEAAYNAAERPLSTKNQLVLVYRSTIRKRRTSHEESTSTRSFLTRRASASDSIERTHQGKGVTYLTTERFTSTATTMIFFAQAIQRGRGGHTPPSGFIHRWREGAGRPDPRSFVETTEARSHRTRNVVSFRTERPTFAGRPRFFCRLGRTQLVCAAAEKFAGWWLHLGSCYGRTVPEAGSAWN